MGAARSVPVTWRKYQGAALKWAGILTSTSTRSGPSSRDSVCMFQNHDGASQVHAATYMAFGLATARPRSFIGAASLELVITVAPISSARSGPKRSPSRSMSVANRSQSMRFVGSRSSAADTGRSPIRSSRRMPRRWANESSTGVTRQLTSRTAEC